MAWLSQFLFGRPGYEYSFDLNPAGMDIEEGPVDAIRSNVAGDLKRIVIKVGVPMIKINSNYLLFPQRNQFAALANIKDTFLSFQTRDDWQVLLERDFPTSATTVIIENSSVTRLDSLLVTGSFAPIVTINGVFLAPDGSGPNYFTGGSYDSISRTITLGTAVPDPTLPVYVTYTYKGWLVNMKRLSHKFQGGWVDRAQYDFQLEGA